MLPCPFSGLAHRSKPGKPDVSRFEQPVPALPGIRAPTSPEVGCCPWLLVLVIAYLLFCFTDHAQLFRLAQMR